MTNKEIHDLIEGLDWQNDKQIIQNSINKLINIDKNKMSMLVLPGFSKHIWDNAALVLFYIGYPNIEHIIPIIFKWLQDINWPGAMKIVELFVTIEKNKLKPHIEDAIIQAKDDEMWLFGISHLIDRANIKINDFKKKGIVKILNSIEP